MADTPLSLSNLTPLPPEAANASSGYPGHIQAYKQLRSDRRFCTFSLADPWRDLSFPDYTALPRS